ncbi:MAG: hypothetical protein Ta2G_07740 [Termitinemataceae bacterium]|nr:MAG: hypothetical protein Ta2G_07740 [Termitinemataceae bacterium]
MENTDYKQKAIEACAAALGNSMINFKKLEKTGELDITSIEDQWSELIIKMKLVIAEYYNDLTADVDEKEIIVKKKQKSKPALIPKK